ncbi:hypothetical protein [Nocardioides pacificus]
MTNRPLFAHVGCSKTGTSALQAGLWQSAPALGEAGVGVPFVGRRPHRQRLLDPFGWHPAKGFVDAWDEDALARTGRRLRKATGDRVLISNEDLVELDSDAVDRLLQLAAGAGLDLQLVVTLRDWAQQIPSEYQQFLRHGMTETYPDFIAQVRERRGRWGEHFWRRQDPLDILDRWSAVDRSRTHLIVVPSYSVDPEGVFRLMGEAVGLDPALIQRPDRAINTSHGVVEAEVFRRVNHALPTTFDGYADAYRDLIRLPFSRGVLPTEASPRILLPDTDLAWVQERAREVVAALGDRGLRVLGDPGGLLPSPSRTQPWVPADEADVARASVETIARFAEMTRRMLEEAAPPVAPLAADEARPPDDQPVASTSGWRGRLRR